MRTRPAAVLAAGAAGVLALAGVAGCGSSSTPSSSTAPSAAPSATAPGTAATTTTAAFNAADVAFVRGMWTLNQQSAALAGSVAAHTGTSELHTMAGRMSGYGGQDDSLSGLMERWQRPLPSAAGSAGWTWGGPGMMGAGQWEGWSRMERMHGADFDMHWVDAAIAVNSAAAALCRSELLHGVNPQARALAQQALTQRQQDLDRLHTWRSSRG